MNIDKNKKNNKYFFKKKILLFLFLLIIIFLLISLIDRNSNFNNSIQENFHLNKIFQENNKKILAERKRNFIEKLQLLKENNCTVAFLDKKNNCNFQKKEIGNCIKEKTSFLSTPYCLKYNIYYQKKPENVKAIYYSAYGASSTRKIEELVSLVKETKLNSVVIDVKEINGKVYMDFGDDINWKKIKPDLKKIISNPKKLIEKLHENEIYVIARIVIFKDASLTKKRPDLAIKKANKKDVWLDYKGKTWVDPNAKEVWDYNLEIARQAYLLGFDEINIDYVRFPTDGPLNNIYYPFSQEEIQKDRKWGRAKVLDNFFYYFTEKLREEFPEIQISADVFGQVALNYDDVSIGQILESALIYFDAVTPMSYPSHYNWNFLPLPGGPDKYPYEVIDKTLKKASEKINLLNLAISNAKLKKEKILLRPNFFAELKVEEVLKLEEIKKDKLRLWYQAFTCTWCKGYEPYKAKEVQAQKQAGYDNGYYSWMLWNASSRYSKDFFSK